jgi:hypothetical protein
MEGVNKNHGSLGFVITNYSELAKSDFNETFPYPERFFLALKRLEFLGSPEQEPSRLPADVKDQQVDAALIVGYYLTLTDRQEADLMQTAPLGRLRLDFHFGDTFCLRVRQAGNALESPEEPRSRSLGCSRFRDYDG